MNLNDFKDDKNNNKSASSCNNFPQMQPLIASKFDTATYQHKKIDRLRAKSEGSRRSPDSALARKRSREDDLAHLEVPEKRPKVLLHPVATIVISDDESATDSDSDCRLVIEERIGSPRDDLLVCDLCGTRCKQRPALVRHMASHHTSDTKEFVCDCCGRRFDTKTRLRSHLRMHMSRAACRLCRKLVKGCNMDHHLRHVHASSRNFGCTACGSTFKTKMCLRTHARIHEKLFRCAECEHRFASPWQLRAHAVVHTSPERLTCRECKRTFAQLFCYRAHMRLHELGHSFERLRCSECSYSTESGENLRKHESKHKRKEASQKLTKDWLQCKFCNAKAKNKLKLASHYWKRHNLLPHHVPSGNE